MAYLNQAARSEQKIITAGIVTLLEGAAIIALINGLTVTFSAPVPLPNPSATDAFTPLPPPSPTASASADHARKSADPRAAQTEADPFVSFTFDPLPSDPASDETGTGTGTGTGTADPTQSASPTADPRFQPHGVRPRGDPKGWASTADYPSRDYYEGHEGTAQYRVTVGSDGRVQDCTITRSSSFAGLDRATCAAVRRSARFEAATDAAGARVQGSYAGSIRWVIPH